MRHKEICAVCGKKFVHYHNHGQKCCSKECRIKHGYKSINADIKNCIVCGKEYQAYYEDSRCCSAKCRKKHGWMKKDPSKKKIYTCQMCGKQFEEWAYRKRKFCSRQCGNKNAARHPKPNLKKPEIHITKICKWCGNEYQTTTHQDRLRGSNFCSRECMGNHKSIIMKGKNNPNYVNGESNYNYGDNWERQKRKAKKRDNHTCQHCGYISGGDKFLDVHHIKPFREFDNNWKKANRLSNLICLCRTCHNTEEQKIRSKL